MARSASRASCGTASIGTYLAWWERRGFLKGMAGEINVRVLIRCGRVAARYTETAPPRECPARWTGPRPDSMIQAATSWARTGMVTRRTGAECPKPGRSIASAAM